MPKYQHETPVKSPSGRGGLTCWLVLTPIAEHEHAATLLYNLLSTRPAYANISHRQLPTWGNHLNFIKSSPYADWCIVSLSLGGDIGSVYLTHNNEIGVDIHTDNQDHGYGKAAIQAMMAKHGPKRYLANVAPTNPKSAAVFEKLGFKLIQRTYCKEADAD